MHAIFVDLWNEILDLKREVAHLGVALDRTTDQLDSDAQVAWEQTHMRASAIEKIYTGCERVMALLANGFDKAPIDKSEGWHVALLKRVSRPFPGVRDGVVSSATLIRLDRLRAFRHRERNSYRIDLDADIVLTRAREAVEAFGSFEEDIRRFLASQGFDPAALSC